MPYNSDGSHQDNNRVSLGGLWQQTDRNGRKYLSGSLGFARMLIFPNNKKTEGSNQPDYNMMLVEKQRDSDKPPDSKPPANTPPPADDDAPF